MAPAAEDLSIEQLQAIIEQKKAQEQAEQRRQEEHKRSLDPSRHLVPASPSPSPYSRPLVYVP